MSTIAEALAGAAALGLARLDAQQLLAHLLGRTRTWLLTHDDAPLSAGQFTRYRELCSRRAAGEPFAYLVGEREFHGLALEVTPAVLVPRPDTETLVDWALELLQHELGGVATPKVIDLGTGSGAIALAVKHRCARAQVQALDASEAALEVARRNARRLQLDVAFTLGDWWQGLAGRRWHLALSNPPYIAADDHHLAALQHEPLQALTPGGDGLGAIDRLVDDAPEHLEPGGWLLMEHGHDQAAAVRARLEARGFVNIGTKLDIESRERCTGGQWQA
jgi:release factor glutamine methyltransferase